MLVIVFVVSFSWCSMVPDDDEIIKGSVLENEIFWNNLDDEWMNNEGLEIDNEEWEEQNITEDYRIVEDLDIAENDGELNNEVDFEVVE